MPRVLFLCHGNIMRSQMAEGYYNFLTHSHDAFSAGIDPVTPQQFGSPHPFAITVMQEEGIDIHAQVPKLVTPEMVDAADVLVVLNGSDPEVPEFIFRSPKAFVWQIEDPYGQPMSEVRHIRDQIIERIQVLLQQNGRGEARILQDGARN